MKRLLLFVWGLLVLPIALLAMVIMFIARGGKPPEPPNGR